jgi:serine protease Do
MNESAFPPASSRSPIRSGAGLPAALLGFALLLGLAPLSGLMAVEAAPERVGPVSFAPVVKQVAPSVVTVMSTKTVKPRMQLSGPDEEQLRRFFGPGFPGLPGGPGDERGRKQQGLGSGVIVSADGLILTNNHVVDEADGIKVALANGHEEYDAKLIGTDAKTDLAVLRIEVGRPLPVITFGDSAKAEVGDLVLAIGNPFGVGQTVTMGIVSARSRGLGLADYEDFLQTDASINPGNSGGALVDATGKLIGINTAILSPSGGNLGIGFAVPINLARGIMNSIISTGKVVRGYLGVMIQPVNADIAKAFKLPNEDGALIGEVVDDGPAAKAGIKAGDVVTSFNDTRIDDPRRLRLLAAQTAPGAKASLTVLRDGKPLKLEVTLGELPGGNEVAESKDTVPGKHGGRARLGIRLTDLDEQKRERFEIPANVNGALIGEVVPGSPAAEAGLKPGQVIIEADRKPVKSSSEVVAAVGEASGSLVLRVWSKDGVHYTVVHLAKDDK